MRPGQTAPECSMKDAGCKDVSVGFNEAGADCPGMLVDSIRIQNRRIRGFNEAGADCPGMQIDAQTK